MSSTTAAEWAIKYCEQLSKYTLKYKETYPYIWGKDEPLQGSSDNQSKLLLNWLNGLLQLQWVTKNQAFTQKSGLLKGVHVCQFKCSKTQI